MGRIHSKKHFEIEDGPNSHQTAFLELNTHPDETGTVLDPSPIDRLSDPDRQDLAPGPFPIDCLGAPDRRDLALGLFPTDFLTLKKIKKIPFIIPGITMHM